MKRNFLKNMLVLLLVSFLFSSFLNVSFAHVVLISPPNGFNSPESTVFFEWDNMDETQNYVYSFQYSLTPYFNLYISNKAKQELSYNRTFPGYRYIYWRIAYHPLSSYEKRLDHISDIGVFAVKMDGPQEIVDEVLEINKSNQVVEEEEDDIDMEVEEDFENDEKIVDTVEIIQEKSIYQEEVVEIVDSDTNLNVDTPTIPKKIISKKKLPEDVLSPERFQWNVNSSNQSILGTKTSIQNEIVCKFNFLKDQYDVEFCNIPKLEIVKQEQYPFVNSYSVLIEGKQSLTFNIQIDKYICDFHLLRPKTWFKCNKKFVESNTFTVSPNILLYIVYDDFRRVPVLSYNPKGDNFTLLAGYYKDENTKLDLVQRYRIVNTDLNIFHDEKRSYSLNPVLTNIGGDDGIKKPFSYPFERLIGVTQWYGNTAFKSHPTGIDIGARKENVLAVGNGKVVSKGWDSYFGQCHSGGNYLRVRQDNGMHTVYFHLDESFVNTGDTISKGQIIAISGNSGAWNCQPLGYHLHFETRLNQNMDSHINPVKYIDIDWNQVPTLGYIQFPGRLSGENPHPGR